MFFSSFGPESVPTSPNGYSYGPLTPIPDSEPSVSPLTFAGSDFLPVGFDASQHHIYEISDHVSSRSKSHSPMDLASPSPPREVNPSALIQLPPLLTPPISKKELNVLNSPSDDPTSSDSSENNDTRSENAVTQDGSDGGVAALAFPAGTSSLPSDPVETKDSAVTSAQMKNFEEQLAKLQVDLNDFSHMIF